MKKVKNIITAVLVLLLCIISSGCQKNGKSALYNYFSFSDKAFTAEIEGNINNVIFRAKLTCSAPASVDTSVKSSTQPAPIKNRREKLEFISPESLCGIAATRDEYGKTAVSLKSGACDLCIEDSFAYGFFDIADILLVRGDIASVTSENSVCNIKIQNESADALFSFDEKTGLPVSVTGTINNSEISIKINWIQFE